MSLYARLAVLIALAVALSAGAWKSYSMGAKSVRAEWTAQKLADSETARLREQAMTKTNERIDRDLQTAKKRDAGIASATADSLRKLQATIGASADTSTSSGIDDPRDAVIYQCAWALVGLDEYSRSLARTATGLQEFSRSVCVAQ